MVNQLQDVDFGIALNANELKQNQHSVEDILFIMDKRDICRDICGKSEVCVSGPRFCRECDGSDPLLYIIKRGNSRLYVSIQFM